MNSKEGKQLINVFQKMCKSFPAGELIEQDPPGADYLLISIDGKTIGIELTEAFHNDETIRHSNTQFEFTNLVKEKLSLVLPFPFIIDIDIDEKKGIRKADKYRTIDATIMFCKAEFSNLRLTEERRVHHIGIDLNSEKYKRVRDILLFRGYRNLPEGITSILLLRLPDGANSHNLRLEGGGVPNFTDEHLNQILEKKERKKGRYAPCDEFWLVIKEGNGYPGRFDDFLITKPIRTSFDKVFLVRMFDRELIELK